MKRPTVVDIFCGAGGLSEGFKEAGFEPILGIDSNKWAIATYKKNFGGERGMLADIRNLDAKTIVGRAKMLGYSDIDMIVGGPPCQGFSTLGDKLSSDPRNTLFMEFLRIVNEIKPKCVLVENVKAFVTMYNGRFRDLIMSSFENIGYKMFHEVHDAADFGVPQFRQRAFFFGTRIGDDFSFPQKTHGSGRGLLPYETVGEHIMDLSGKEGEISGHIPLAHSDRVIRRYKLIPEGGKLPSPEKLPADIRRKNFGNTYKRLSRNDPSLTLVPGNNAFPLHPTLDRSLTPREAARLQTFPDSFKFEGDRRSQCILVGNAVPPRLARTLAEGVMSHMKKYHGSRGLHVVKAVNPAKTQRLIAEDILPKSMLSKKVTRLDFIDLFSGAGGFTIGFSRAGWKPLLCVDNDENVSKTHSHNYPSVPFSSLDLSRNDVAKKVAEKIGKKEVGVIVGGPPCQGFSVFGNRRFVNTRGHRPEHDKRNNLVYSFMEVVREISPRWFVMENVPGLASIHSGKFIDDIVAKFKSFGYANTEARILNAADYGVPQKRRRLVIIGNRTGHIIPWPKKKFFEQPKEWQKPYRTAGEAISDLSDEASYSRHSCHVPMKHKPLLVERYKLIPEGGKLDVDNLPERLRNGYRTESVKNYSHVHRRLSRNEASLTLVPGHNAFPIHPWLNRALTPREAARLQTFPDEVVFLGSRQNQCIQVGNAFPPLLAELIANNITKAEINGWYPGKVPKSAYYSLVEKPQD